MRDLNRRVLDLMFSLLLCPVRVKNKIWVSYDIEVGRLNDQSDFLSSILFYLA